MIRSTLAAAATALALAACQSAGDDNEQGPAPGALEIPALEYTQRTLDNGLRVYSMPDDTTASVSIQSGTTSAPRTTRRGVPASPTSSNT